MALAGQSQAAYKSGAEGEGFALSVAGGSTGGPGKVPMLFGASAVIHSAAFAVTSRPATDAAVDDLAAWRLVLERVDHLTGLDPNTAVSIGTGRRIWESRIIQSGGSTGLTFPFSPALASQRINVRVPAGALVVPFIERLGTVSDRNITVSATFDISYSDKGVLKRDFTRKNPFFVLHGGETTGSTTSYNALSLRMTGPMACPIDPVATTNEIYCPLLLRFPATLTRLRWAVMSSGAKYFRLSIRASKIGHALNQTPYAASKAIFVAPSITVASTGRWTIGNLEVPNLKIPQFPTPSFEPGGFNRTQLFAVVTPETTGAKFSVASWLEFMRTG